MRHGKGHGELRERAAEVPGELKELADGLQLGGVLGNRGIEAFRVQRGTAGGQVDRLALAAPAGQETPRKGAPGQHPHPVALADRQHRRLDPPGEQGVGWLLGPEALKAAALGDPLRLDDLLGREGRAAEGADPSLPHQVTQHPQRLLDIGCVVGAMDLVQVDPVGPQPLEALLDRIEDPAPRVAAPVGTLAHREVDLGGEHDVVTPSLERLSHDLLGLSRGIHVRGVDEVDPLIEATRIRAVARPDRRPGLRRANHPSPRCRNHPDSGVIVPGLVASQERCKRLGTQAPV
jgi:hypothetical protein